MSDNEPTGKKTRDKRYLILVALVMVFVISGGSLLYARHNKSVVATEANLAERKEAAPTRETKLSFKDKKDLPKTYVPGEKLTIHFVIENQEGKTVKYPFVVTANGTQVAAHDIEIATDTGQNIDQSFELPANQDTLTIEVRLPDQNKSISFTMDKK